MLMGLVRTAQTTLTAEAPLKGICVRIVRGPLPSPVLESEVLGLSHWGPVDSGVLAWSLVTRNGC